MRCDNLIVEGTFQKDFPGKKAPTPHEKASGRLSQWLTAVANLGEEEQLIAQSVARFEWIVASNIIFSVYGIWVLIMGLTFKFFLDTL